MCTPACQPCAYLPCHGHLGLVHWIKQAKKSTGQTTREKCAADKSPQSTPVHASESRLPNSRSDRRLQRCNACTWASLNDIGISYDQLPMRVSDLRCTWGSSTAHATSHDIPTRVFRILHGVPTQLGITIVCTSTATDGSTRADDSLSTSL